MPTETYVLAIDSILVDRGDHQEKFVRGQSLEDVPDSTLDGMIRLGQAVTQSDFDDNYADKFVEEDEEPDQNWADTAVGDLGLSAPAFKALNAGQLHTVREVMAFGAKHDGLSSIEGVGDAIEREVQEAIARISE